jgi:hypothetical protein
VRHVVMRPFTAFGPVFPGSRIGGGVSGLVTTPGHPQTD